MLQKVYSKFTKESSSSLRLNKPDCPFCLSTIVLNAKEILLYMVNPNVIEREQNTIDLEKDNKEGNMVVEDDFFSFAPSFLQHENEMFCPHEFCIGTPHEIKKFLLDGRYRVGECEGALFFTMFPTLSPRDQLAKVSWMNQFKPVFEYFSQKDIPKPGVLSKKVALRLLRERMVKWNRQNGEAVDIEMAMLNKAASKKNVKAKKERVSKKYIATKANE